jgi:hypothetical protein
MLTFVLGVITGLAAREIADYLPASRHFSRTTLRSSSGCPSASEKASARRQRQLNLPNVRQDVGRKLRRLCLAGHAHALHGHRQGRASLAGFRTHRFGRYKRPPVLVRCGLLFGLPTQRLRVDAVLSDRALAVRQELIRC